MTQATTDLGAASRSFYADLDANDPDLLIQRLADDAVFAFNDHEPVTGAAEIAEFIGTFKGGFRSITHDVVSTTADQQRGSAGVEVVVTYALLDGRDVRLKGCSFLDFAGDRVTGYRVYIDTSQLS